MCIHEQRGHKALAKAACEQRGESLRRNCLDSLIPSNELHLKITIDARPAYGSGAAGTRTDAKHPTRKFESLDASRKFGWGKRHPGEHRSDRGPRLSRAKRGKRGSRVVPSRSRRATAHRPRSSGFRNTSACCGLQAASDVSSISALDCWGRYFWNGPRGRRDIDPLDRAGRAPPAMRRL